MLSWLWLKRWETKGRERRGWLLWFACWLFYGGGLCGFVAVVAVGCVLCPAVLDVDILTRGGGVCFACASVCLPKRYRNQAYNTHTVYIYTLYILQTVWFQRAHSYRAQSERLQHAGVAASPSTGRGSLPRSEVPPPPPGVFICHGNSEPIRVVSWGAVWVKRWVRTERKT